MVKQMSENQYWKLVFDKADELKRKGIDPDEALDRAMKEVTRGR